MAQQPWIPRHREVWYAWFADGKVCRYVIFLAKQTGHEVCRYVGRKVCARAYLYRAYLVLLLLTFQTYKWKKAPLSVRLHVQKNNSCGSVGSGKDAGE